MQNRTHEDANKNMNHYNKPRDFVRLERESDRVCPWALAPGCCGQLIDCHALGTGNSISVLAAPGERERESERELFILLSCWLPAHLPGGRWKGVIFLITWRKWANSCKDVERAVLLLSTDMFRILFPFSCTFQFDRRRFDDLNFPF